ncbi:MAG: hypothetical protein Q3977_04530 [Oscillospiraceae bacterium]|nr:hypothetical protein [Oscillospiraceae bacterium]
MLQIIVPSSELFDQRTQTFETVPEQTLQLEHSLISLSKWESKWKKPFLSSEKNNDEMRDYIRCMTLTPHVQPTVYMGLTADNIQTIRNYIDDPMTATTINDRRRGGRPNKETVTSELIYYWMIMRDIPWECQKWHLNRLMTLIRICDIKDAPQKKMSRRDILAENAALNSARRAKHHTRG